MTTVGEPGISEGVFGSHNFSLVLPTSVDFTPTNWNVPQPLYFSVANDSGHQSFIQQAIRVSYRFQSADPYYSSVLFILPTTVIVSDSNGGCPEEYSCINGVSVRGDSGCPLLLFCCLFAGACAQSVPGAVFGA